MITYSLRVHVSLMNAYTEISLGPCAMYVFGEWINESMLRLPPSKILLPLTHFLQCSFLHFFMFSLLCYHILSHLQQLLLSLWVVLTSRVFKLNSIALSYQHHYYFICLLIFFLFLPSIFFQVHIYQIIYVYTLLPTSIHFLWSLHFLKCSMLIAPLVFHLLSHSTFLLSVYYYFSLTMVMSPKLS